MIRALLALLGWERCVGQALALLAPLGTCLNGSLAIARC